MKHKTTAIIRAIWAESGTYLGPLLAVYAVSILRAML